MTKLSGFVYKWTNELNGRWYIGSHEGTIDDGYVGSGISFRDAIVKHGIENFVREILYEGPEFRNEEQRILTQLDAAHDPASYNHKNQALGAALVGPANGMFGRKLTKDERFKCGSAFRGKKRPDHSERMKGENNPRFGKSDHTRGLKRRGEDLKGKTFEEIFGIEKAQKLRKRLSETHQHIDHNWQEQICPHCGLVGRGPNMTRYHFDNCDLEKIGAKKCSDDARDDRRSRRAERRDRCSKLYSDGVQIADIAKEFACSEQNVYRQLKKDGVVFSSNRQEIYCVGCHERVNMTTLLKYHNKCFKMFQRPKVISQ